MHSRTTKLILVLFALSLTASLRRQAFSFERGDSSSFNNPPSWAQHAVWYQIFPERFRNGDATNDPTVQDIQGSWPHEIPEHWSVSSWTGDWYALQRWEEPATKGFYYFGQQRRYGGDIQGVLDKLDYLHDLGIDAIYFNPLFEAPSLHKYDASMYHHIDNNFGPDPAGDRSIWEKENPADHATWGWTSADRLFLKLLDEAHQRGIKVIIDGVFNHVGVTFWAFLDVQKNGVHSLYKEWFIINSWDDPSTTKNEFDYAGWAGVRDLPELREDENGLVNGPREHVRSIIRRWMDPNGDGDPSDGIDGWRLDVAEMVAIPFWRDFRKWVREINPEAYLVGEVWWEDWAHGKMFNAEPWLRGDAFDAVMNYRVAREAAHFFKDQKNRISPTGFDARLRSIRNDYRSQNTKALMNVLGGHDTDRLASQIVNPDTRFDAQVGVSDNREYQVRKPNSKEIEIQKLIVLFQMTYVGAPHIFYGDEAGMWGADDPDDRKPMLWSDLQYDDEVSHPFGTTRPKDKNLFNKDLFEWYRRMIHLRKSNEALRSGSFTTVLADDTKDCYVYLRSTQHQKILVLINNSPNPESITVENRILGTAAWTDLLSGNQVNGQEFRLLPTSAIVVGVSI